MPLHKTTGQQNQWKKGIREITSLAHCWVTSSRKKCRLKLGREGSQVAAAVQRDEHEKAMTEERAKFERNDPMDVNETKQSSWSEAEKSSAAETAHKRFMEQMER